MLQSNHHNGAFSQIGPWMLQVIAAKELTRYRLQQIVTAREDDLLRIAPPASIADLEKYGRDTAAQLLLLQVKPRQLLFRASGIAAHLQFLGEKYQAPRWAPKCWSMWIC